MTRTIADGLMEIIRERDRTAAMLQSLERRIAECEAESFDLPAAIADAEERGDLLTAARLRCRQLSGRMATPAGFRPADG
jgi:hypothetical protein